MSQENTQNSFNDSATFNKTMVDILSHLLESKLTEFLEYCISTNNATPIKKVLDILDSNQF